MVFRQCLLTVGFAMALAIGARAEPAKDDTPIQIGLVLCQTGNCADWGTAALQGSQLASEEVNAAGGVLGRQLELVNEDSAESISGVRAVTAFQSLLSRGIRIFVGPSWSPGALAIAPLASKRSDIVVLTPSASAREFSRSGPNIFNLRLPEELATRMLARIAFARGSRRAAVFSSQQPAESTQGRIFADEFRKIGGTVSGIEEAPPTLTDLRAEASRLLASKPDAVFLMNYNQLETGITALNNLGFKGVRLAISLDDARVQNAKGLLEGVIVTRAAEPSNEFRARFRSRFAAPPGLSAEGGYDAVWALARSIEEAGSSDTEKFIPILATRRHSGAIGEFSFSEDREIVQSPVAFVVQGGQLQPLDTADLTASE